MEYNARTMVCGLIGNPVGHSISPLIHNTISDKLGINMAYVTFKVENDDLGAAIRGAHALNIKGLNVTVPHKERVIPYLAECDDVAKAIGAVNTLVWTEEGYKGYNTDYIGLARQLKEENVELDGREVIVLGAGGAARAAVFMCAMENVKKVYIINRTFDKALGLSGAVNAFCGRDLACAVSKDDYLSLSGKKYIVIQTTSLGLYPKVEETFMEAEDFYGLVEYGVDIIFNPPYTRFMELSDRRGAAVSNGLGMLLYQGVAAYELWNDVEVPQDVIGEVYARMRQEMRIS